MLFFIMGGILLFILLTIVVNKNLTTEFDEKILAWFDSIESTTLDSFFALVTWLGSLWVLMPVSLGITAGLLFFGYRIPAVVFGIGFVGAVTTTYLMKFLLERTRPELFEIIGNMPHDSSYPSAHTIQAFAFVFMLSLLVYILDTPYKVSLASVSIIFAILVGISRIYLQVHFPSDVIAGILVSSIWAGIMIYFIKLGVFI